MDFGLLYIEGLHLVFQPQVLLFLVAGVLLGISIGCIPGLTVIMAVAVLTPFTYDLPPLVAILALIGIYCGGNYGGSISACLVNVPGTPSAIMTTLDGYPLTLKGKAGLAIGTSTVSSFFGGLFSVIVLTFLSPVVARFALNFISAEYFALGVLGISLIAYLGKGSNIKGLLSGLLGLFLATVGADSIMGYPRFTFGSSRLITGLEFVPVMIGLLGIAEILIQVESGKVLGKVKQTLTGVIPSFSIVRKLMGIIVRSSVVGVVIGAIPGAGGTIASIVAYGQQKRISRHPEEMGEGSLEGIAAAEGANNACTGGAMLTMMSLGIPGDAVTGVMIGALMIHGLTPGPVLFKENFELVSSIFIGMLLANILVLVLGLGGARFFAKLISAPKRFLNTAILSLAVVGSFAVQNSFFDVGVAIAFGAIGYAMMKFDIPRAPLVLGLILGPLIEKNLRRSLLLVEGDVSQFLMTLVTRPISATILLIILFLFFYPFVKSFFINHMAGRKNT